MSTAKRVLIFALVLLVAGVGAIGVSLIPANEEAPKYECVTDGSVSFGFSGPDQGDYLITAESYQARAQWKSQGWLGESAYTVRKTTVGGMVLGIIGLTAAGVMKATQRKKVFRPGMWMLKLG